MNDDWSYTPPHINRWWWPTRQRTIVLEFPTAEDADRFDANPAARLELGQSEEAPK